MTRPRRRPCGWRSSGARGGHLPPRGTGRSPARRGAARAAYAPTATAAASAANDSTSREAGSASGCHCTPSAERRGRDLDRLDEVVEHAPARGLRAPRRPSRRPGGGGTWWRAGSRRPPGRPASPAPGARRGRRCRTSRSTRRCSVWPRSSGRCWISVPPCATLSSCMPRQMPSNGRSRSSARSASATSARSRSGRVLRSARVRLRRRRSPGRCRRRRPAPGRPARRARRPGARPPGVRREHQGDRLRLAAARRCSCARAGRPRGPRRSSAPAPARCRSRSAASGPRRTALTPVRRIDSTWCSLERDGAAATIELDRPQALQRVGQGSSWPTCGRALQERRADDDVRAVVPHRRRAGLLGRRGPEGRLRRRRRRAAPTSRPRSRDALSPDHRPAIRDDAQAGGRRRQRRRGGHRLLARPGLRPRVAAESAYFLLAFVNIGLVPDGGSSLLIPERVGLRARRRDGPAGRADPGSHRRLSGA